MCSTFIYLSQNIGSHYGFHFSFRPVKFCHSRVFRSSPIFFFFLSFFRSFFFPFSRSDNFISNQYPTKRGKRIFLTETRRLLFRIMETTFDAGKRFERDRREQSRGNEKPYLKYRGSGSFSFDRSVTRRVRTGISIPVCNTLNTVRAVSGIRCKLIESNRESRLAG